MNVPVDHEVLLELIAFVDQEHETNNNGCHPRPGVDCVAWCEACSLIKRVPGHMVVGARVLLNSRGIARD